MNSSHPTQSSESTPSPNVKNALSLSEVNSYLPNFLKQNQEEIHSLLSSGKLQLAMKFETDDPSWVHLANSLMLYCKTMGLPVVVQFSPMHVVVTTLPL